MLGKLNFSESFNIFGQLHIKIIRIKYLCQVVDTGQFTRKIQKDQLFRSYAHWQFGLVKFCFVQNILTVLEFYPFFGYCIKWKKISFLSQDILPSERFLNLTGWQKVSKSRKQFMVKWILQKNERWISALEDYYFKVNTKRESMFFLQEHRLSFVLTLK